MIRHVRLLAILMYVNAAIALVVAGVSIFAGAYIFQLTPEEWGSPDTSGQQFGTGLYAIVGAYCAITASLQVVAARKLQKFRGRQLALVALSVGALNTPVCCCIPVFSFPLMVFGIFVLLGEGVREAFEIAERNDWTPEQVLAYFANGGQGLGPPPGAPPPPAGPGAPPATGGPFGGPPPPRSSNFPPGGSGAPPPPRSL